MSSEKKFKEYLLTYTTIVNNINNKTNKKNSFFPSKPNNLKDSKKFKKLRILDNESSIYKKCRADRNSFCMKNEDIKENKIKVNYMHASKNNYNSINEKNDNKENYSLNYQNDDFITINNTSNNFYTYKKLNINNKKNINRENINNISKMKNRLDRTTINDLIYRNNTCRKEEEMINKEIIRSKISELSSLKKLIFEDNNFKNIRFFQGLHKTRNKNLSSNINVYNTLNIFKYSPDKLNKHEKRKSNDINKKLITNKIGLRNYLNKIKQTKPRKINLNFLFDISYNNFTNTNSRFYEKNKTYYISSKEKEDNKSVLKSKDITITDYGVRKYLSSFQAKQEILFDKKKLIEKLKKEKLSQSRLSSKNKNKIKFNPNLDIKPLITNEKLLLKIKNINKRKRVLKIDSCTVPGILPLLNTQKKNKNSCSVIKEFLKQKEHFLLTISDGHGLYGHLISKYLCNIFPLKLSNVTKQGIEKAFQLTNKFLITKSKIDCLLSGASFSSVIVTQEKIISSNVGICKGVLAQYENGQYTAIDLTKDHNINDTNEIKRIVNNGGIIKNDGRIYIKDSTIPGMNITRSFGDKIGRNIGIIDIPYIQYHYFKGNEKFLLLASNGIWKFIDSKESVKIIKSFYENGMDSTGALKALVKEAVIRWKREKKFVDDITAILLFFD